MIVSDLQQFLRDLARLLNTTDAKKSSAELHKIVEGLDPFKTYSIADFADFLPRAEDYSRTGMIPVVAKPPPRPNPGGKSPIDLDTLRDDLVRLYSTAGTDEVTLDFIEGLRPRLEKLKKADLVSLAQSIELAGMSNKTVPVILDAIVNRLRSIKQSSIRTSIIDRPGAQY